MDLPDLPEGWQLTHLINLGDCWQANISSEVAVIVASGTTPRYALLKAIGRIGDERFERVKLSAVKAEFDILKALNISRPEFKRRV
jgi:hypothetical protein